MAALFIHSINDCPYSYSYVPTALNYYKYLDPRYKTVPSRPRIVAFNMTGNGSFSASVTNDSRYNVDVYEWKADYTDDWYIYAQNANKSTVGVYGSSTPRSCYLSARAHNNYGWGDWQSLGWLYVSQSYSLSVAQNPANLTLGVIIKPVLEEQAIHKSLPDDIVEKTNIDLFAIKQLNKKKSYNIKEQTYSIGLYNNTGTCVYQSTLNNNANNIINLNINTSSLPNGIYFLHVKNIKTDEIPQTLTIVVKH